MTLPPAARMEFHVSRKARDRYQFDEAIFTYSGNVVFANFHAARTFAQKINARRDLVSFPEQAVRAGQINALGLVDEILHVLVNQYRQQRNPKVMSQALEYLDSTTGRAEMDNALRQFCGEFPPVAVYQHQMTVDEFLSGESTLPGGQVISNREVALEEMLMLWVSNMNPAYSPYLELFDDSRLEKSTAYLEIMRRIHDFFNTQPLFGPDYQNLIDILRAPAMAVPHSLTGQLEFIRGRWGVLIGKHLYRLLSSLDLVKEEEKAIFFGPGPSLAPDYKSLGLQYEPEAFSPDRDWMPNLVLIAKNAYVWLDQLTKKYKRPITRLDEIPDEELDALSRYGFTGLWLIGLWERSMASKSIKQMRGNPDAVASAYSLFAYDIASELGGDDAYRALRDRAWKRGIRLASDMVPNHMGIDSRWVIEHPDWFISQDISPFPAYTFDGPNLSWDGRVGLYLEDHYYNNTDAAVVFKRVDFWTGATKYIYHGNDGTSMPWNDTAQLNYLLPEVREAVIQTILHVARHFPIIRFDAAMTLAKKHYQRLWFPEPGSGGDIPSRAEHAMTKEQLDVVFPVEFWREVVDRVAQEVPDTLLLAEAFWLMEGYFVRTLGMHRVYNSAFMNMLRDEKNQEYRLVIKNTVEFDPEILKRYVNFMNNPDERTAVDQFGKGDKYFGICTLMATMPGLPMFGHGQIEGFTEKYGMEFHRAYWDERADGYLVERHEREIFPLLRRRYLFADVRDFLLYDFYTPDGYVNEDVFAYSNQAGNERALVVYHNKFATARGWIRISTAQPVKTDEGRTMVQKTLAEGLGLIDDPAYYTIYRDHITGLEYIRNNRELHDQGLYIELEAYKYQVFMDFQQVQENEWGHYHQVSSYLNGRGVPSIEEAITELFLQPVYYPFNELMNAGMMSWLVQNRWSGGEPGLNLDKALEEAEFKAEALFGAVTLLTGGVGDSVVLAAQMRKDLAALLAFPAMAERFPLEDSAQYQEALEFIQAGPGGNVLLASGTEAVWGPLLGWLFTAHLGATFSGQDAPELSRTWMDEWLLGKRLALALQEYGLVENDAWRAVSLVKILQQHAGKLSQQNPSVALLKEWLQDADVQRYIGVNRYQGILWFNKEAFEELLWWLFAAAVTRICARDVAEPGLADGARVEPGLEQEEGSEPATAAETTAQEILACYAVIQKLIAAEKNSGYQIEKLLAAA